MDRRGGVASTIKVLCVSWVLFAPGLAMAQDDVPRTFQDCPTCPEMVVIPAGRLSMGSPVGAPELDTRGRGKAEAGIVEIAIERPFGLGKFEVTRGQYAAFVAAQKYEPEIPFCRVWDKAGQRFADVRNNSWRDVGLETPADDSQPVACVSWDDAIAFTAWLSTSTGKRYRLPSEAEWEYAARAGSKHRRFWGDDPSEGCAYANTYDLTARKTYPLAWTHAGCVDGFADLAPVGSLIPNAWGLHDMIGNVWEWAADCFTASRIGRPKDQRPWVWKGCPERIIRGGSWMAPPNRSRVAYSLGDPASDRYAFLGFRVARDLEASEAR